MSDTYSKRDKLQSFHLTSHRIAVTFFPDKYAKIKQQCEMTLPMLGEAILTTEAAKKTALPWLKLAVFDELRSPKGCLRTNSNLMRVTGIEVEHDAGSVTFDEAVAVMAKAGIRCLVYTSPSYIAGEKERWRILLPLSEPELPEARAGLVARVNGLFQGALAEESFTLSTAFYYGRVEGNPGHRVELVDSEYFIDGCGDLDAGAIGRPPRAKAEGEVGHAQACPGIAPGYSVDELKGLLEKSRTKGKWHNAMLSVVASLAGQGQSDEQIYDFTADYCKAGWGDNDIEVMIEGVRRRFGGIPIDSEGLAGDLAEAAPAWAPIGQPNWRERYQGGQPKASLYNAILAIETLRLQCSEDTFHNRLWIGRGDAVAPSQPVPAYIGQVNDARIGALRLALSNAFGLDFTEKHIRDGVAIMCHSHCFDPVCDMLEEAQENWDGTPRLEQMAVDYFNCENTELNCRYVRKTMIGAVARARDPGCKFDTILTMESPEGLNKSSAWAVLAGEGNFSDQSILHAAGREVQEQLAGVWIHENAELAGVSKAEVEAIKAFASRQVDRARPAYGHFLLEQPRHSIEVATTNEENYLMSATGNRRFWSIRVLAAIDLAKLRRDRLQLWGEAGYYQAQGESVVLDEHLWVEAAEAQDERRVRDPWEALIAELSHVAASGPLAGVGYIGNGVVHLADGEERVGSAVLLEHVFKVPRGQQHVGHTKRLANAMRQFGWSNGNFRVDGVMTRGYRRKAKN